MGKKKKDKCVSKNKNRKEKIPKQKEIKPKKKYSKSSYLTLKNLWGKRSKIFSLIYGAILK